MRNYGMSNILSVPFYLVAHLRRLIDLVMRKLQNPRLKGEEDGEGAAGKS